MTWSRAPQPRSVRTPSTARTSDFVAHASACHGCFAPLTENIKVASGGISRKLAIFRLCICAATSPLDMVQPLQSHDGSARPRRQGEGLPVVVTPTYLDLWREQ
jgi:hypothetical protein